MSRATLGLGIANNVYRNYMDMLLSKVYEDQWS